MIERGNALLVEHKRSKFANPAEKNELLEIATALGRLAQNTNDEKTVGFLSELRSGQVRFARNRDRARACRAGLISTN
ncbi:MAG: hypothetical protein IPJ30_14265 [Acidobacteria bacterium]|nr:hypothetical protein [Acidobacteriota bacterium]